MMNSFQKFMLNPEREDLIWKIIELYHPDIERKYISPYSQKEKLSTYSIWCKYDWIVINGEFNYIPQPIGNRVLVNIGIEFNLNLYGTGWEIKDFEKEFNNNLFKSWRFAFGDSKYKENTDNNPDVNALFKEYGVPKPTPKELMIYYYKD